MHLHNPLITSWQKQIILGTCLGGSSLVGNKTCYLSMRSKKVRWLLWKAKELHILGSPNSMYKEGGTYRWRSLNYPIFTEVRESLKDIGSYLDNLRDIGICTWFEDAGKFKSDDTLYIIVTRYKEKLDIFHDYFQMIDIPCEIKKNRGTCYLCFDKISTEKILKLISPIMPHDFN